MRRRVSAWSGFGGGVLLLLALCGTGRAGGEPAVMPMPAGDEPADWIAWRDAQIRHLLTPFDHEDPPYIEILGVAERAAALRDLLRERMDPLRDAGPVAPLLRNLYRFADAVGWQGRPGHTLGFPLPDDAYLDRVSDLIAFPLLLRSPPFLEALRHPATYGRAQELLDAHIATLPPGERWLTLWYRSRFIETPDRATHGRLLVWVPGTPEQWIQFGIATPTMDPDPPLHGASIVALAPGDAGLRSAVVDYWRDYDGDGVRLTTKVAAVGGSASCFNCHKTPVLPIHPYETYRLTPSGELTIDPDGAEDTLRQLNARIRTFGAAQFGFGLAPLAHGPPVGPPDRERSLEQVREWIAPLVVSDEGLHRVRDAMRCAECHYEGYMGRLNFPTALVTDQDFVDLVHPVTDASMPLLREYILQGWMPPGENLPQEEREPLYRALMREYHDLDTQTGLLAEWLRDTRD